MRTTQRKGGIALSQAIATFTKFGYDVLLPITESAAYDLVVDINNKLYRIQIKYTSNKEIDLRNIHSNSNGYVVKKVTEKAYDWLYVYSEDGLEYIKKKCLFGRRSITTTMLNKLTKEIL